MEHPIEMISQLFKLPQHEVDHLSSYLEEKHFGRGERIEARNLMLTFGYYVLKGMARVYYVHNGREHTFSFALENEYIMLSHLLLSEPHSFTCIEFLEPTDVIFIPFRTVGENLGHLLPDHARSVIDIIANSMRGHLYFLEERMILMQTFGAAERYAWMEQRYPRVLERATITQVASFLGVAKETLYRLRAKKRNKNP